MRTSTFESEGRDLEMAAIRLRNEIEDFGCEAWALAFGIESVGLMGYGVWGPVSVTSSD